MGLDSITSRVVINGKLSNKSAIGRRGQYTAFLRFSKRFCGADFIENLVNGNIKVRDFRTAKSISDMLDPIRHDLALKRLKNLCCSLISKTLLKTVSLEFTNIIKRMDLNQLQLYSLARKQTIFELKSPENYFRLGIGSLGNNQMDVFYFELLGLKFANFAKSKRNIRQCLKKTSIGIDLDSFASDPLRNKTYCAAWAKK